MDDFLRKSLRGIKNCKLGNQDINGRKKYKIRWRWWRNKEIEDTGDVRHGSKLKRYRKKE